MKAKYVPVVRRWGWAPVDLSRARVRQCGPCSWRMAPDNTNCGSYGRYQAVLALFLRCLLSRIVTRRSLAQGCDFRARARLAKLSKQAPHLRVDINRRQLETYAIAQLSQAFLFHFPGVYSTTVTALALTPKRTHILCAPLGVTSGRSLLAQSTLVDHVAPILSPATTDPI